MEYSAIVCIMVVLYVLAFVVLALLMVAVDGYLIGKFPDGICKAFKSYVDRLRKARSRTDVEGSSGVPEVLNRSESKRWSPEPAKDEGRHQDKLEQGSKSKYAVGDSFITHGGKYSIFAGAEPKHDSDNYLIVRAAGHRFAFEVSYVTEVIEASRLRGGDGRARRAVSYQGAVMPVFDLNDLLGSAETSTDHRSAIVAFQCDEGFFSILVEFSFEILGVRREEIKPDNFLSEVIGDEFVMGVAECGYGAITFLDVGNPGFRLMLSRATK